MTLRYLSLFSGIGGFDLGFDRAGMECAGQVEIDDKARAVLARHWPDAPRMTDVKEVKGNEFGTIDVICGGFPCQDVSVAGRRKGLAGERSGLWFEFHRLIDSVKPGTVIIENVPGLLSSNEGRDFAVILRGLVECGYGVAWRVLDAQYFGVAQRRRRVFIVGSLGTGRTAEILFEREGGSEGGSGDIAEGRSARPELARDVAASLKGSSGERGFPLDFEAGLAITPYVMAHGQANAEIVKDGEPSLTLNREQPIVAFQNTGYGRWNQGATATTLRTPKGIGALEANVVIAAAVESGGNDGGFRTEPGEHLVVAYEPYHDEHEGRGANFRRATSHGALRGPNGTDNVLALQMNYIRRERVGDKVGTLQAQPGDAQFNGLWDMRQGVRRLTPVECERLQGFPDNWTDGQSDSTRYRQLGNAVAVPVAEWLGRRILETVGQ